MNINIKTSSILMIILGIISILFPLALPQLIASTISLLFLVVAISLIISGLLHIDFERNVSLINILLGVLSIVLAIYILFNPKVIFTLFGFITYVLGLILLISGIFTVLTGVFKTITIMGLINIIFGILYLIVGIFLSNPLNLGIIVGLWLLCNGILNLFNN